MHTKQHIRSGTIQRAVNRFWDNVPIADATTNIRIVTTEADIANAKRKQPGMCALANTCKRSLAATKVMFFRTTAYVEIPDENGDVTVQRFMLSAPAKKFVADFDKGRPVKPHCSLELIAPIKSSTIEYRRVKNAQRAKGSSSTRPKKPNRRVKTTVHPTDIVVRNGSGMAFFK